MTDKHKPFIDALRAVSGKHPDLDVDAALGRIPNETTRKAIEETRAGTNCERSPDLNSMIASLEAEKKNDRFVSIMESAIRDGHSIRFSSLTDTEKRAIFFDDPAEPKTEYQAVMAQLVAIAERLNRIEDVINRRLGGIY